MDYWLETCKAHSRLPALWDDQFQFSRNSAQHCYLLSLFCDPSPHSNADFLLQYILLSEFYVERMMACRNLLHQVPILNIYINIAFRIFFQKNSLDLVQHKIINKENFSKNKFSYWTRSVTFEEKNFLLKEEKENLQNEMKLMKKRFDEQLKTTLKGKKEVEKALEMARLDLRRQKMVLNYENKRREKRIDELGELQINKIRFDKI